MGQGTGFPTREAALARAARFARSLDLQTTLQAIADEVTGPLADWCVIDLLDDEGQINRAVVLARDGAPDELAQAMQKWAPDPRMPRGVRRVIDSRQPTLYETVTDDVIVRAARGPGHAEMMRAIGMQSYLCVPLLHEGNPLGTIMLLTTRSRRVYRDEEAALLREIADRAAVAIEHATRFSRLQQLVQQQTEVLSMVCHDLGNPLGTILVSSSALLERQTEGKPQLELILRAARTMRNLLRGLTDASSTDGLRGARVFDLRSLIMEALDLARPQAQSSGISLQHEPPSEPLWVWCDAPKVAQALANLIGNAVKFTETGGTIYVCASRSPDGEFVEMAVRDTGRGIAQNDLPRLFERGWRAPSSVRGNGLGLWITRKIVEAHGGKVWAESEPGAGSTFYFSLPSGLSSAQREDVRARTAALDVVEQ
jgi:signal transduction histidine kinase